MERRRKLMIGAAVAAAFVLAVALGAVGALVASSMFSDDEESRVAIEEVTATPDVEPSESLNKALDFLVDEAVEAGRLTEEEGAELKELLESGVTPSLVPRLGEELFGNRGFDFFGLGGPGLFGAGLDLDAAASYLGLSESELEHELDEGQTLAEIARAEGKSVDGLVQELVDSAETRIDDAVADGRLSEERAADLKQGLEEGIRDRVNEELPSLRLPFRDFWRDLDDSFRGQSG